MFPFTLKTGGRILYYTACIGVLGFLGCTSFQKNFIKEINESPHLKNNFTGFVLLDPQDGQILLEHQGERYFTPASNTKLFTFYLSQRVLGDSIPSFRYVQTADSLWIWGTGDPTTLHVDFNQQRLLDFLRVKRITLVKDRGSEPKYGPGWSWDDYQDPYQMEKSTFPVYGNALNLEWDSITQSLQVVPDFFKQNLVVPNEENGHKRELNENIFYYYYQKQQPVVIPFITSYPLTATLLGHALKDTVAVEPYRPAPESASIWYSHPTDSVLRPMLQQSDNFMAEQLVLLCSQQLFGESDSKRTILYALDTLLPDLPQRPEWVDGSGLSRYNMFTPQTIAALLLQLYREIPSERLFHLLPAGGESGTIEDLYKANPPYIYAKTGTLRHNHALSGYLLTKKGRVLIFSFMHNHFTKGSLVIKREMERLLRQIHNHY